MPPRHHSSLELGESNTRQRQTIFYPLFSYLFTYLFWTAFSYCTKPNDLRSCVPHHRSWCEDRKCNLEEFHGRNRNLVCSKRIMQSSEPSYMTSFGMSDACCRYVNDWARLNNCCMHIQASVRQQCSSVFFIYLFLYIFTFATSLPKSSAKTDNGSLLKPIRYLPQCICWLQYCFYSERSLSSPASVILLILYIYIFYVCASSLSAHGWKHTEKRK